MYIKTLLFLRVFERISYIRYTLKPAGAEGQASFDDAWHEALYFLFLQVISAEDGAQFLWFDKVVVIVQSWDQSALLKEALPDPDEGET